MWRRRRRRRRKKRRRKRRRMRARRHLISFSLRTTVDHTLCDEPRNNGHENDYV